MHSDPAQPIENMRFGGKLAELGVQFQEHVLGRLLGHRTIAEDAESNAEDHALVFQHQVAEALLVVFFSNDQVVTWRISESHSLSPFTHLYEPCATAGCKKKEPRKDSGPGRKGVPRLRRLQAEVIQSGV
jgi:hypothetical protein